MRRLIPLAVLAVLALPATALAAPVKISPHPSEVSASGAMTVEAANPNSYALRGTATVTVGKRTIAKRSVRLPKRAVSTVALRFNKKGLAVLRKARGRAKMTLKFRRGGRTMTARRTLALRLASATPQPPSGDPSAPPAPGNPGGPTGPAPTPPGSGSDPTPPGADPAPPAPPVSNQWVGRMGTEGPYDDFELTVIGGQMQMTKVPFVPVSCFENGGSYRSAISLELFDAPGPWTVGTDENVAKQGIAVNQLVGSGARSITYKVTESSQDGNRITGKLGMSFFDSKYDVFTNTILFINCAGAQSFEAVPAG